MRSPLKWCGLLLVLIICGRAEAADDARRFYGYAFDVKGEKYLYTEVHEQKFEGDKWVGGSISYFAPDGSKLGQKTLDFSVDPFIPLYEHTLPAREYREGIIKIEGNTVLMSKTSGGQTRTKAIKKKNAAISGDSGFHNFIRAHFKPLMAGETVHFTLIAAGKLDTFKFRAKRIEGSSFEGRKMVRFLVEPNSLLRLLAPELIVTYDPDTEKLVRYEGPNNVIDPEADNAYNTRISYFSEPPAGAPENLPPLQ